MPTHRAGTSIRPLRPSRQAAVLAATGLCLGLGLTGCARDAGQGGARLDPSDFRAETAPPAPVASTGAESQPAAGNEAPPSAEAPPVNVTALPGSAAQPPPRRPIRMTSASEASAGVLDVSVVPGPPRPAAAAPAPMGAALTLDSKVGEINGQPIIASKFFEPLDGRLRALAAERRGNHEAWHKEAGQIIADRLRDQILSELLLAEAYASLTPEVREFGIRAFLTQFREDLVRQNEGSRELAEERLREREGVSIDQKTKEALQRTLIQTELVRRIQPRIYVSTRDQREYYDRNFAQFNPPGTARLRLIRVPAGNQEGVEQVRAALASGPFEEAARLPANIFRRDAGGEHTVQVPGLYEDAQFFGIPELNDAAKALEPGTTIGPIPAQNTVAWVHLEAIDRPPGVSFYEAQLEIASVLLNQKSMQEQHRYHQRLLSRGSFSDMVETVERLLNIATERYFGGPPR